MEQVEKRVKEVIATHVDIAIDINTIKDSDFLDILGVNSINFIRAVIDLETEYNIQFDIEMLGWNSFANIGELIKYVNDKVCA